MVIEVFGPRRIGTASKAPSVILHCDRIYRRSIDPAVQLLASSRTRIYSAPKFARPGARFVADCH